MKGKPSPATDMEAIIPVLIGAWRRLHKLSGPPDVLQTREFRSVIAAVTKLQERFTDGKTLVGQDYFSDPELLGAYLLYHWVLHYQEGLSLLGELPVQPKRVLDICSGPASFAFAALRHGVEEVIAIDQNMAAMTLGAEVCGRYGLPLSIRQWRGPAQNLPVEGKFDLIIAGYCLDELFPSSRRGWAEGQRAFVRNLAARLTPQGYLLIVDSSYSEPNRRILQLRDDMVAEGVPVQAPCIWRGECPALKAQNSPCYAQREFEKPYLIKEIQRAASINLSSLKMSYIIFRNSFAGWPELPNRNLYRVISPPVESYHGKRFYLCGTGGKKQLSSRLKMHPKESRAFEYLRRGEVVSFENALEAGNAIDIVEGTTVRIEAACGKHFHV